jgi:uncharacterized RDD family membrane protein YckC
VSTPRLVHSPEHVLIALEPAGLGARFAAFLIDAAIIAGLLALSSQIAGVLPRAIATAVNVTASFLILWGYFVLLEVLRAGQSVGKQVMRLRVVDARGLPIELPQSLVRNIVRLLDLMPMGGLGMACVLFDPHRRRLGDLAADTLVVRERGPSDRLSLAAREARRHNSLATPRTRRLVKHRLGLEERELLLDVCLRAPDLEEGARLRLFEEIGDRYREILGIEDKALSGENLVRGLVALAFEGSLVLPKPS